MHARRTFAVAAALAFALALAAPATASAQAKKAAAAPAGSAITWGFLAGIEDGDLPTGLSLRVDGILPFRALSPKVKLSWVGSLGFANFSESTNTVLGEFDASANILKLVPAARFTFPVTPKFDLYGDAGLGLYLAFLSASGPDGLGGTIEDSSTEFGFLMRFAVGGMFAVSPTVRIGAELGLNPYFGDVDDTTFSALAAATFRF
jgi:hypothetical protein